MTWPPWGSPWPNSNRPWRVPTYLRKPFPWKTVTIILAVLAALALFGPLLIIGLFSLVAGDPTGTPAATPAYPVVVGARIDADELIVSTGRECPSGTSIQFTYGGGVGGSSDNGVLNVTTQAVVNQFNLTTPANDFIININRPPLKNWNLDNVSWMLVRAGLPDDSVGWQAQMEFSGLAVASTQHPSNEFYFGDFGWLTPEEVAARDGVDLLTVCSPV